MSRRRRRDRRAHHAANPDRSRRLLRLLGVLKTNPDATSLELIKRAGIVALSAAVSELRLCGHRIDCYRSAGLWRYTLKQSNRRSS